jgi:hypothetical protein
MKEGHRLFPTGLTGFIGFFCFHHFPDESDEMQSRRKAGKQWLYIARIAHLRNQYYFFSACLRIAFSLGEGSEFLPFIPACLALRHRMAGRWKGKKYPEYPVNPVWSELTRIYEQLFIPFSITVDIAYLPLPQDLLTKTV